MPLLILPRHTDANGTPTAQAELQAEIDDPQTVVVIIYGEGPDVDRALEVAVGRAAADDLGLRRVVYCPDDSVLSDQQRSDYFVTDKVLVAIGLADKIADSLTASRAGVAAYVERAFARAEKQAV